MLEPVGGLALVAAVQHAFGLAMGVALYALLLRQGAPRWVATVAAAPVLLDRTLFPQLLALTGDAGARGVLQALGEQLALVESPDDGVLFDVDEQSDLTK